MSPNNFTPVEMSFFEQSGVKKLTSRLPYIMVDNFPGLGQFTALRFLEWVLENPEGVISLPTGKTPEYFIKWTQFLLQHWNEKKGEEIRKLRGLENRQKPDLRALHFVQIDEFYPILSDQHNSFYYYVNKFYIEGFGLDRQKALLINCDDIPLAEGKHFGEVFPESNVDLSLRYRECKTAFEQVQQRSIFMIDDWCKDYEGKIREMGGIGFFLGGIGPDGHIAFNTRGSDHYSTTRLTATNFETQAVSAGDLGGIEVSRNRLVITIGLETITYNPDAVAIIFAAGEAKGKVVRCALEEAPSNLYPATVLQKLPRSRFYLTRGAACRLSDRVEAYYKSGGWTHEKSERAVINLCAKLNKFGGRLEVQDLRDDPFCKLIPDLNAKTVDAVIDSITRKIEKGLRPEENQTFLHTGPHHDDIMLGLLPHITHQLSSETNICHFAVLTSGFTAVTNSFVRGALRDTAQCLAAGRVEMTDYPDFFDSGYKYKWDKDVYHFLNKVAAGEPHERRRGLCHRIVRAIVDIYAVKSNEALRNKIAEIRVLLDNSYDGKKNPPEIQRLKGMIREFEEELVWAHFGVQVENVHHLRLGFYTGDIFTEIPERKRDVAPIYKMLKEINPTVISLTLDPEGSGPDTHYKVLQATAEAVREWQKDEDLSKLRIWGYRNVWYRFEPAQANVMVPVGLDSMAVLDQSFANCYLSQVDASFPSYEHDGKFSELASRIWVQQLKEIQFLLGKDFFYQNSNPRVRACHGLLLFREMNVDEFLAQARQLEKSVEGMV